MKGLTELLRALGGNPHHKPAGPGGGQFASGSASGGMVGGGIAGEITADKIKLPRSYTGAVPERQWTDRERERVAIMENHFPGTKFSDMPGNPLGIVAAKKAGEPGAGLPSAIWNKTSSPVMDIKVKQKVLDTHRQWADKATGMVSFTTLKFGSGESFANVFGVVNAMRAQDPTSVLFMVNRRGHPVYVRLGKR